MGILRVTVEDQAEILAVGVKLHVQIEGETFVMGNAALEKSRELREFVSLLREVGVLAADIHVQSVRIASASGLLTRQQKVEFGLIIRALPAQLPEVLGVVSAQRTIRLQRLDWVFDDFEASLPLAAQAMHRARRKADVLAEAAGHRVTGVHSASDSWEMPVTTIQLGAEPALYSAARSRQGEALEVGVEYSAAQTIHLHLTVDFTLE